MNQKGIIRRFFMAVTTAISLLSLFSYGKLSCERIRGNAIRSNNAKKGAFQISQMYVSENLSHGSTGTYPDYTPEVSEALENGMYRVRSHVDITDRFGKHARLYYDVTMNHVHVDSVNSDEFGLVNIVMSTGI